MVKRSLLIILALAFAGDLAYGEVNQSVELQLFNSVLRNTEGDFIFTGIGSGNWELSSTGYRNVKAELSLSALIGSPAPVFSIDRSFIKVRFPWFRLNAGKTRLSWGEGAFFNAGDILFGSTNIRNTDLTSEVLRDQSDWLLSLYVPLARFSFLEAVVLPPEANLNTPLDSTLFVNSSAAIRAMATVIGTEIEGGYRFNGNEDVHIPYIAAQGNLFVDWYAAASAQIPHGESDYSIEDAWDSTAISFGILHILSIGYTSQLSLRFESLVSPGGYWEEQESLGAEYGIYLFPEASLSFGDALSVQIRSIISPIDISALTSIGGYWNVYQDFSFLSFITVQSGEEQDIFGWNRYSDLSATLGMKFSY
ncbi:MAG: hypothetical protein ACLFR1_10990 [Spirochaetia bacterium]